MECMERKRVYPKRAESWLGHWRKGLFLAFVIGFLAVFIVNLCVGGRPFCLYVLGGEVLFWILFVYKPMVEGSPLTKFVDFCVAACLMLKLIEWLSRGDWSETAIGWIAFSLMILSGAVLLIGLSRRGSNPLPLFWLMLGAAGLLVLAWMGVLSFRWPIAIACFVAAFILFITLVFFRSALLAELKKRFHM